MRHRIAIAGAAIAIGCLAAGGVAVAASPGDEQPLTGESLERATKAALAATSGGVVIETETGEAGAAYEVELRLPDGRQIELSLDGDFRVVGREADDDGANDGKSEPGDD